MIASMVPTRGSVSFQWKLSVTLTYILYSLCYLHILYFLKFLESFKTNFAVHFIKIRVKDCQQLYVKISSLSSKSAGKVFRARCLVAFCVCVCCRCCLWTTWTTPLTVETFPSSRDRLIKACSAQLKLCGSVF